MAVLSVKVTILPFSQDLKSLAFKLTLCLFGKFITIKSRKTGLEPRPPVFKGYL